MVAFGFCRKSFGSWRGPKNDIVSFYECILSGGHTKRWWHVVHTPACAQLVIWWKYYYLIWQGGLFCSSKHFKAFTNHSWYLKFVPQFLEKIWILAGSVGLFQRRNIFTTHCEEDVKEAISLHSFDIFIGNNTSSFKNNILPFCYKKLVCRRREITLLNNVVFP